MQKNLLLDNRGRGGIQSTGQYINQPIYKRMRDGYLLVLGISSHLVRIRCFDGCQTCNEVVIFLNNAYTLLRALTDRVV